MANWIEQIKFVLAALFNLFFFFLIYLTQNVKFPCSTIVARALATFRGLFFSSRHHSGASEQLNELLASRSLFDVCTGLGYAVSTHSVITIDAYSLTVFRLWNPSISVVYPRPAVILWHGMGDSCHTWIANGPAKSLAFLLADAGFDVLLANNRGTAFGGKHAYLSPRGDPLFWHFSLDACANYDVPAVLDFAVQLTGEERVALVTHSEGSAEALAALSLYPELADRLSCLVALSPLALLGVGGGPHYSPLLSALAWLRLPDLLLALGASWPVKQPSRLSLVRELHCWASTLLPAWLAHDDLFSLLLGPFHGMAPSLYSATVGAAAAGGAGGSGRGSASWGDHQPGAVSLLDLCHWTQTLRYNASARAPRMTAASPGTASASGFLSGVRAPALRMCDFGARENLARYGQAEPPQYDLARIPRSLPKAFFCGGRDQLMALSDLEALVDRLRANAASPTPAHLTHGSAAPASPSRTMGEGVGGGFKVGLGPGSAGMGMGGRRAAPSLSVPTAELLVADIPSFNHTDYLWDEEAYTILYPKIVAFLSRYTKVE